MAASRLLRTTPGGRTAAATALALAALAALLAHATPARAQCAPGHVVSPATAGRCCWPAQRWNPSLARCDGPPACPAGFGADGDECVPLPGAAATAVEPGAPAAPVSAPPPTAYPAAQPGAYPAAPPPQYSAPPPQYGAPPPAAYPAAQPGAQPGSPYGTWSTAPQPAYRAWSAPAAAPRIRVRPNTGLIIAGLITWSVGYLYGAITMFPIGLVPVVGPLIGGAVASAALGGSINQGVFWGAFVIPSTVVQLAGLVIWIVGAATPIREQVPANAPAVASARARRRSPRPARWAVAPAGVPGAGPLGASFALEF